jgi:hypothetical protein
MSAWSLAAGWLTVIGLVALALGTGAQAAANFSESKGLFRAITDKDRRDQLVKKYAPLVPELMDNTVIQAVASAASGNPVRLLRGFFYFLFVLPFKLPETRSGSSDDDAVRVLKLIHLSALWFLLLLGSALALVAAIIQLTLAYHVKH